jgi:putative membrane protein
MMRSYSYRLTPDPTDSLGSMLIRAAVNALGLFTASLLVPGVHIGDWQSLIAGTAIFAIVNTLLKPPAALVSCCLVVLTFGLFTLVINAAMLMVSAWAAQQLGLNFQVDGFWSAVFGSIVISIVSLVATAVTGRR